MISVISAATQTLSTSAAPASYGDAIPIVKARDLSIQCNVTVATNAAGTFAAGSLAANHVTVTAHGWVTGVKGQVTTTGALPTGLSTSTDYFIIVVDANTVKFASSYANAAAGTAIAISGGTGNSTFTPTAIAGATVALQKSNDGSTWLAQGSPVSVTASGSYALEWTSPCWQYARVAYVLTAGSYSSSSVTCVRGS